MKITFIFHSSFAVELEKSVLIFDYYGEGRLPIFSKEKQVYFLNSHGHHDHFNREILDLKKIYPQAEYILSRDIRVPGEKQGEWIHSVRSGQDYVFGEITVHTLRSTDQGVAFSVEAEGKALYHAGDLNWWHWEGEEKAWNNNMAANYKREMDKLAGHTFDAAFIPLDPRLDFAYYWGMKYFLEKAKAKAVFPMHCWEQYEVCREVLVQPEMNGLLENYHGVEYPGQEWDLCW